MTDAICQHNTDRRTTVCNFCERRDRFAAAALTGLMANGDYGQEASVQMSVGLADALIKELDK